MFCNMLLPNKRILTEKHFKRSYRAVELFIITIEAKILCVAQIKKQKQLCLFIVKLN
jgi:hypothetical protein